MSEHLERAGVQLTATEQEARARSDMDSCSIVLLAQQRAGMLNVLKGPLIWKVAQIQIEPEFQNQGLGSTLLTQIVSEARQFQVPVQLSVLKANPARKLYERLGFKIVGQDALEFDMQTEA